METRLNGLNFFYTDSGSSSSEPPIIFLHAFPADHTMWQGQVHLLQSTHRVITYDHRGLGRSDAGDGQITLEFLVDDFFALLDSLKIPKAIVAGLSMGGYVALRAMERDPKRFHALILCDTRSEADSNEGKVKRAGAIKTIKTKGLPEFGEGFLKGAFAAGSFQRIPEVIEGLRQTIEGSNATGVCGAVLAMASRTDTTAVLSTITQPTLILVGEEDALTPPAASESMHSKIAGSQFFKIPQAGHMSNLENPSVFNQHLLDFLKRLPR